MMTVRDVCLFEVVIILLFLSFSLAALVSFDQLMVTVNEGEGATQVCITCSELPEREIIITLETQPGTAQGKYYVRQNLINYHSLHFGLHTQLQIFLFPMIQL